ncbi:hypothetical protein ACFQE1_19585 [Halobium palmae]|uniref:Uncharacterized protein n=1 Tax=Halobium palmae TaxID=1776492 RepID=A0ABD5S4N8_9EURY
MGYTWQYYDVILLGIFLSMSAGALGGYFTTVPMPAAVAVAGLVAIAFMAHGLFVNGPVDRTADLTDEVDALN